MTFITQVPGMSASKLNYTVILVLFFVFHGCGPGRTVSEPSAPQPDWVRSRPIVPGYYIGIGWAQKTGNVHQYQQTARQNALADLAGEISINISSSSVLHAFESSLGFKEDFSSTIKARTQQELEGYEIIDTWDDQDNYWVYYRLSAARHQEIKERRRDDAASLSAGLFENALKSREEGELRNSLVQMISSLEAIKNYFDDPLPVEFRGRKVQLGNELYNELSSTISQIEITPSRRETEVKRGQEVTSSQLMFTVAGKSGKPVAGFPVVADYSERPIRNNKARSGRDGLVNFHIDGVRSSRSFEVFRVSADMEAILSEATSDPVIRRLIRRFSLPGAEIRINILSPVIALKAREENLGEELSAGTLGESFRKKAVEAGYVIVDSTSKADYMVRINASTSSEGEKGIYHNAVLTGNVTVELPNGTSIYHRDMEGYRGSHFDARRAGEEAFRQAIRRMESSFFREIDEAIKGR